jgi:hypothetical protein
MECALADGTSFVVDKKKRGEMIPPLTIVSVLAASDYGFFTGFFGARLVAAGFLT